MSFRNTTDRFSNTSNNTVKALLLTKANELFVVDLDENTIQQLRDNGISVFSSRVRIKYNSNLGDFSAFIQIDGNEIIDPNTEGLREKIQAINEKVSGVTWELIKVDTTPTDGPSFPTPDSPDTDILIDNYELSLTNARYFTSSKGKSLEITAQATLKDVPVSKAFAFMQVKNQDGTVNNVFEKEMQIGGANSFPVSFNIDDLFQPTASITVEMELQDTQRRSISNLISTQLAINQTGTIPTPKEEKSGFFDKAVGIATGLVALSVLASGFGGNPFKQQKKTKSVKNGKKKT